MFEAEMTDLMATLLFISGKGTTIKESVHLAHQIREANDARIRKQNASKHAPTWVKAATEVLTESNAKSEEE